MVTNGQTANATTFNNAYVSKSADDTKTGTLGLNHTGSGTAVTDTQQAINDNIDDIATNAGNISTNTSNLNSHTSATAAHGVAGDIVGTSDVQVLTLKDIDGGTASDTTRITIPKDTKSNLDALTRKVGTIVYASDEDKIYYDNGSDLVEVGSGSGSGGINYITNPDAENNNTDDWSLVRTEGGSPVRYTFAVTSTTPLRGTYSFLLTKDLLGDQEVALDTSFTIDNQDIGKSLYLSYDFEASANYDSSYMAPYIYDVTNTKYIPLSGSASSTGFTGHFTATDSTSYKLRLNFIESIQPAYTIKFDNFKIGPDKLIDSPIISDWVNFTPTGSWTSNATYEGKYRRVGSNAEIETKVSLTGAPNAANLSLNLPTGLTIDTGAIFIGNNQNLGTVSILDSGTTTYNVARVAYSSTTAVVLVGNGLSYLNTTFQTMSNAGASAVLTFATGDQVFVRYSVPILEWANNSAVLSTTEMMNQTVKAHGLRETSSQAISAATATLVAFNNIVSDNTDSMSVSGSRFTVPRTGAYRFSGMLSCTGQASTTDIQAILYKNGSGVQTSIGSAPAGVVSGVSFNFIVEDATVGDYYEIYTYSTIALSILSSGTINGGSYWNITSIPDFSVYSVYGQKEYVYAASSVRNPVTSNVWLTLVGNSVTLSPGTWVLNGICRLWTSGGATGITRYDVGWYSANGTDAAVRPTYYPVQTGGTEVTLGDVSGNEATIIMPTARVNINPITTTTTIYIVPYGTWTTPANANAQTIIYAERLG